MKRIVKRKPPNKVQVSITLSPSHLAWATRAAKEVNRTRSSFIDMLIGEAMGRRAGQKEAKP